MRHVLLALFAGLLMFPFAARAQTLAADSPEVRKAEQYLQSLTTAQADFIQTSSMGGRLSGKFYLSRPGKLRFDYNEVEDFVVADGVFIYFYDSQLGEQSNAPIGQTLADFLLRKDLTLHGDLSVQEAARKDGNVVITVAQSNDAAAGKVELVFSEVPYRLDRWRVMDAQGQTTEIILKNLQTGIAFKNSGSLFSYHNPKGRKRFND